MAFSDLLLPEKGSVEWSKMLNGELEQCEVCGQMFTVDQSEYPNFCSEECKKFADEN